MSINAYLCDTMSGRIKMPIDIPSISWNIDVSDSSLSTTKDKGIGDSEMSGLQVPWDNVPGRTWAQKRSNIAPMRTSIAIFWRDDRMSMQDLGIPFLCGAIGIRSDTVADTSFQLLSPLTMLGNRYAVKEGEYANGPNATSPNSIRLENLSYRAIASEIGYLCTNAKPNGALPIDWQYRGERGTRVREYEAWNVQNLSAKDILTKLANIQNGPDMQFRPYLTSDNMYVRYAFTAGSDANIYLGQNQLHYLAYHPDYGSLQNLTVDHLGPIQRVYATGAGQDKTQITAIAQDSEALINKKSWPLAEMTYSDSDTDSIDVLRAHAKAILESNNRALIQLSGHIHTNRTDSLHNYTLPLGSFWPGELFRISVNNYPALPDGDYTTRLMEMSGDTTDLVKLKFDVMQNPEP